MSFSPARYLSKIYFPVFLIFIALSSNLSAQTKKSSVVPKKNQEKNQAAAKNQSSKVLTKKPEPKAEKNAKQKTADSKKQAEEKKRATLRNAEENKRRAEIEARQRAEREARRQAALAEQRRRAQIAREAQARRIAFERGLRLETIENIKRDETDGEDLAIRRAAVAALGNHAGTVVVLEPHTGKVLSIVNQEWAIRQSFKPCSVIKLVTGVAGLNENIINGDGSIRSRRFPLNLDDALAYSNNTYFQAAGKSLGTTKMIAYAQMLGLGTPTGINAKNETGGRLPYGNSNTRIYSHGDDFEVTPLQLGVLVSAISNGGRIVIPQIPRGSRTEKAAFRGAMRYQLKLPSDNLQGVIPGMIGATAYGTARRGVDSALAVAGKTGSCIGGGSWVGLFASVAPIENPKYAVIVITRGQSERGKYAAAIAGKIYQSLRSRLLETGGSNLAAVPLELRPQTKVNAKISAELDTDEDNDSEDNDAAIAATKEAVAAQSTGKRAVVKKDPKAVELFPTVVVKVRKADEPTRPRIVNEKK